MSRKPSVVISPTFEPFRSISALVATVVACRTSADVARVDAGRVEQDLQRIEDRDADGSCGVDSTLKPVIAPLAQSSTTQSVNVPPVSTAISISRPVRASILIANWNVSDISVEFSMAGQVLFAE